MGYITLAPYAQGNGSLIEDNWNIVDPPTLFGGGSLSDGSDASGVTFGTERDTAGMVHGEPIALWFKTPSGMNPTALLLQTRMRNNSEVIGATIDSDVRQLDFRLLSSDGSVAYNFDRSVDGDTSPVQPLLLAEVTTVTDFVWWGALDGAYIDLANPTAAGGWYMLDQSYNRSAGDKTALTGDGLRLELGMFYDSIVPAGHLNWIDTFEVRLLVASNAARYPLRRYPPVNNGGFGPTRHWPRSVNRRAGGSY